jgi:hypothetical protein
MLCFLVSSCAHRSTYFDIDSNVDKTFCYYEQDRYNKKYGISNVDVNATDPNRLPSPALVDLESNIRILVNKSSLQPRSEILAADANDLLERKNELKDVLSSLEQVIEARQRALTIYRQRNNGSFDKAQKDFGAAQIRFIEKLQKLYPDRASKEYEIVNDAMEDHTLITLRSLLQARLDAVTAEDNVWVNEAKARSATLRLQAFLERSNKEKIPLHLHGYDTIPEGSLRVYDRLGLNLSEEEKQRLDEQIKATSELSIILNQVKNKEISFNKGLQKSLSIVSEELGNLLQNGYRLIEQLQDQERYDRIENSFNALVIKVKATGTGLTTDITEKIEGMPSDFEKELMGKSTLVSDALEKIEKIKGLQHRFSTLRRPEELTSLLTETSSIAKELKDSIEKLNLSKELEPITKDFLLLKAGEIHQEVSKAFRNVMESQEAKALITELNSLYRDLLEGKQLVDDVLNLLNIGGVQPVLATPEVPEVLDVDINELENSYLNLKKVPGRPGDIITLTATLKENGKTEKTSQASFELTRYGWYAVLSPSVVLVRPDQQSGEDNDVQFAPVVSWNHHYYPRPQKNPPWYISAMESLQPAVGIHAAFLPYDVENNAEIGLGGTMSFWDDRLQLGIGHNLMAASGDDGQIYYFIGSDLIGLLQSIGIGARD